MSQVSGIVKKKVSQGRVVWGQGFVPGRGELAVGVRYRQEVVPGG